MNKNEIIMRYQIASAVRKKTFSDPNVIHRMLESLRTDFANAIIMRKSYTLQGIVSSFNSINATYISFVDSSKLSLDKDLFLNSFPEVLSSIIQFYNDNQDLLNIKDMTLIPENRVDGVRDMMCQAGKFLDWLFEDQTKKYQNKKLGEI